MSAQTIYQRLVQAGMSPEGACAMLGNMQEESALRANNVQDGYGYTDEGYTAKVDSGQIEFIDSIGYGLCQWTYGPRKLKLLQFARQRGVSIGDEAMQVDFCINELRTEYPKLWLYLCDCKGVAPAADKICEEYERPAVNNFGPRREAANGFYMQFGGMAVPEMGAGDYPSAATGGSSPDKGSLEAEVYWPPRTLEVGMYGPDVVALQGLLIAHGYPAGITGTFDNATRLMLMAFQGEHGLKTDGIAGPLTWTALTRR